MPTKQLKLRARVSSTDPEWERMKAARRNIDHDAAVQESDFLHKQFYALWGDRVPGSPVDLNLILRTLIAKKIPFVLTGAHAIGGWTGRPRSTKDVDILVKGGRNHVRAVNAIRALYPQFEVRNFAGVVGFFPVGDTQSVIDVTYPHRADIEETLANPVWTENKELGLRYRIPALEAALANKYGAMLALNRPSVKRLQDIVDFSLMVQHSADPGRKAIDLEWLERLGEKVWPNGGGKEILGLVDQVKAGRTIQLDPLGRFLPKNP